MIHYRASQLSIVALSLAVHVSGCTSSDSKDVPTPTPTSSHQAKMTPPPDGAVILWDGSSTDQLVMTSGDPLRWGVDGAELLVTRGTGDVQSATPLGSGHYHIEWLSPEGGSRHGQRNGNSGVKIESRYEVQILNTPSPSDALPLPNNEAGSIYALRAPDHNASAGAGNWQSYDIVYTAPTWSKDQKQSHARMSVWWNGVLVHNDIAIPNPTGARATESPTMLPLLLQDHATTAQGPVRFRNIWHLPGS